MRHATILLSLCLSLLFVPPSLPAAERQPQKWAMLVGVNDYANLQDLRYASKDMQALAASLISAGFPESHVFQFHDEVKDAKFKPLKANIERQLRLMMNLAEKGDVLLVAFSGHGMFLEGKSFLCPTEAQDDNPAGTMIAVEDVYASLEKCPAAFRLMLVDACRNDPRPAGRRSATPKEDLTSLGKTFEKPPDGILVLTSCAPGQISYEEDEFQHGVFMNYVLKGLGGEADGNKDGKVSLGELYEYSWLETKTYVARARSDYQSPQQFGRIEGTYWFERTAAPMPVVAVRPEVRPTRKADSPPTASLPQPSTTTPSNTLNKTITNSIGMGLVLIPAGDFLMGSTFHEANGGEQQHRVRITKSFYMAKYEVTQREFTAIMDRNPSFFQSANATQIAKGSYGLDLAKGGTTQLPVDQVIWQDCIEFCQRLSAREKKTYRLPTEAEWEYACRAGTNTAFHWGNTCNGREANCAGTYPYGTQTRGPDLSHPTIVGSYPPNQFGLYDMHGNVKEWCADWYHKDYYESSTSVDPLGPPTGDHRVLRGGAWSEDPSRCRAAGREYYEPHDVYNRVGFRVVMEP